MEIQDEQTIIVHYYKRFRIFRFASDQMHALRESPYVTVGASETTVAKTCESAIII